MNVGLILQHIARSWRHHLGLQLATVFVLSLVLIMLSFVLGFRQNVTSVNSNWGDNLELTVYMKDGAAEDAVGRFVKEIQTDTKFSEVHFIDKAESVKRFAARMGQMAPEFATASTVENPLPAYLEIRMKSEKSAKDNVGMLKAVADRFSKNELVDDVSYGRGWIENWASFLTTVQLLSGAAVALTILMGLLVVGNSVRMSLSQRRDEIEILELVGATPRWIRLPFIAEGAVIGVLASVFSAAIGYFLQMLLLAYLHDGLAFWSVSQALQPLSIWGWAAVTMVGVGFGALGAYSCVRHLNSGWSAAERWNV